MNTSQDSLLRLWASIGFSASLLRGGAPPDLLSGRPDRRGTGSSQFTRVSVVRLWSRDENSRQFGSVYARFSPRTFLGSSSVSY